MHFLIEVVANELPDPEHSLFLYVENLVVNEDVRVFIEVEGILDPIDIRFELLEPVVLDLWEVQLAEHGALILERGNERVKDLGVT